MATTLAYILHTRSWRETSLLVDVLTQEFGRIKLIAKGAKRPHSLLRGLLEPFNAVNIEFTGKSNTKHITQAHWVYALNPLHPAHILPAWYLSELCLYSLGEDDPAPLIFKAYHHAIQMFANYTAEQDISPILRQFEYQLLFNLGLWPDKQLDAYDKPLNPQLFYSLDENNGWRETCPSIHESWCLQGELLLNLANVTHSVTKSSIAHPSYNAKTSLRLAMRSMLAKALHGHTLSTRVIWQELETL